MDLPAPRSISTRSARDGFSLLLDEVAAGSHVLVCRRSKPLAALIPAAHLDRFRELTRREAALAAILRGHGYDVDPSSTSALLEVIVARLGAPR